MRVFNFVGYPLTLFGGGLLYLLYRIAGEAYAQLVEDFVVDLAEHYRRVHLTTLQFRELVECLATIIIVVAQERERNQHLISV